MRISLKQSTNTGSRKYITRVPTMRKNLQQAKTWSPSQTKEKTIHLRNILKSNLKLMRDKARSRTSKATRKDHKATAKSSRARAKCPAGLQTLGTLMSRSSKKHSNNRTETKYKMNPKRNGPSLTSELASSLKKYKMDSSLLSKTLRLKNRRRLDRRLQTNKSKSGSNSKPRTFQNTSKSRTQGTRKPFKKQSTIPMSAKHPKSPLHRLFNIYNFIIDLNSGVHNKELAPPRREP